MKIVSCIYNLEQLNNFKDKIDCALIMVPKLAYVYEDIDVSEAVTLCKLYNIMPILCVNKLMMTDDLALFNKYLDEYKDSVYYYASDLGIANILRNNNIIDKLFFNPETMICNSYDLSVYYSLGFHALSMSLEIPLKDMVDSFDKTEVPLISLVYGKRLMFYSKRKLLSLYKEKANIVNDNNKLYLREATRNDLLPLEENYNGTFIYRSYPISLHKNLCDISFLHYALLDPYREDNELFTNILSIYYDYSKNKISADIAIDKLNNLNIKTEDGFIYNDSVYVKEEF